MSGMEAEERSFWVWLSIFVVVLGTAPFAYWQGYRISGIVCAIAGLGGLFMLIRDHLTATASNLPIRISLRVLAVVALSIIVSQLIGHEIVGDRANAGLSSVQWWLYGLTLLLIAVVLSAALSENKPSKTKWLQGEVDRLKAERDEVYADIIFAWLRANIHTAGTFSAAHLADLIGLKEHAVNSGLDLLRSKYQIVTKPSPLVDSWSFSAASSVHLNPTYKMVSALTSSNPVKVSLVPWRGKGEKMFLTVTNLGAQRQDFQAQCRILARRNDPNAPQLITFDLQWEYGERSYTLVSGQAGNLLIASAGHSEHKDIEWLQLESAGSVKPQRSDWNWGDRLPEYDIEVTILGDGEPQREKFTVRAGKECAIKMDKLGAAPAGAPIEKPKEASKITPFIYTNVISLSVDEKTVSRGKNIKIRYVIESSEDASDKIWLGASVLTDKKTGEYFSNTDQDKYISLVKGRHEYDRDLRIPMNAPPGVHLLRANLWHVITEGKSMIIARGTPIEIEIVA
jgi:hypothetical protein